MNRIQGLYAIADQGFNPLLTLPELAQRFLLGGCKIIQLRMKGAEEDDVYQTAREIMRFKDRFEFIFVVNDFVDVALKVRADGVHVGQNDMPLPQLREYVGNQLLAGYSAHSFEEAIEAQKGGADYVALGAIFPTKTKGEGHPVLGVKMLTQVTGVLDIPVVAIGGINRNNFEQVFKAGAKAAAMITALTGAEDIVAETRWFVDRSKGLG